VILIIRLLLEQQVTDKAKIEHLQLLLKDRLHKHLIIPVVHKHLQYLAVLATLLHMYGVLAAVLEVVITELTAVQEVMRPVQ